MKLLLIAFLALVSFFPVQKAHAQLNDGQLNYCRDLGAMAASIMIIRQSRYSQSDLISELPKNDDGSDDIVSLEIIADAYSFPVYRTDEYVNLAVVDFQDYWENTCLDVMRTAN